MGTVVSFDVPGSARRDGSLEAAIRWLHWVDRVFSPYRADSDVSLLARGEVTVDACAPEMAEVLAACAAVRDLSGGYFTAAPGGQFDPSGYVKGWAVERAAALLAGAGSADHVVNGGGDVQCAGGRGRDGGREPWRIGIADPLRPGRLALVVGASDCAVATSGTAERGPHILDPHTGQPRPGWPASRSSARAWPWPTPTPPPPSRWARPAPATGQRPWRATRPSRSPTPAARWHTPGFARYIRLA